MSHPALRRYRAERLLRRDFGGLRARVIAIVRSRLRARGVTLDAADLDACYSQAWHGLYGAVLGGERVEDPGAWLVLVTFRRAIDESRSRARQVPSDGTVPPELADRAGRELAVELDDRERLRQLFEGLNARLSPRERQAASLCYLQGLSRSEAAMSMGVSEGRMRKLMEGSPGRPGVAHKVGALLDTIRSGRWCEQQSSLVRAYAFGVLDPAGERHRLAVAHLRECPSCRTHVASLRGLAAALPPLLLGPLGLPAGRARAPSAGVNGLARSLTAKLALVGALALGGGGYAVLASGASGTRSGGGPHGRSHAQPRLARPRVPSRHVPARARRAHRVELRAARPAALPKRAIALSQSQPARETGAPDGEFTPERAR